MNTRNKALIITGIVVALLGLGIFFIALAISGWDFKAFFQSTTFIWILVLLGVYILAVVIILVKEWYNKL